MLLVAVLAVVITSHKRYFGAFSKKLSTIAFLPSIPLSIGVSAVFCSLSLTHLFTVVSADFEGGFLGWFLEFLGAVVGWFRVVVSADFLRFFDWFGACSAVGRLPYPFCRALLFLFSLFIGHRFDF